jgi:hypothetical protein
VNESLTAGSGTTVPSGNNTTVINQSGPESPAIPLLILLLTAFPAGLLIAGDLSRSAGKRSLFSAKWRAVLASGYAATAGLLLYSNLWVAGRMPGIPGTGSTVPGYILMIVSSYLACSGIALSSGVILSRPFDRMRRIHVIPGVIVSILAPFILISLGSGYVPAFLITVAALVSSGLALWQSRNSIDTALIDEIRGPTGSDAATRFTQGRTITSAEVTKDLFPSELRDRYHEMNFLGMGGMSRVFSAKRNTDGRMVAVKIPISFDTTTGKCFMKEILAWEGLRHENIVEITEANILPVPYVEMEYIRSTLDDLQKPLPARKAAEIVCGIAEGLAYAHERAIIHRDIKPQNILLTPEGVPKITDWGMSRAVGTSMLPTVTGFSLSYAAPEQVSPGKFGDTDQRTDIYQLGVVFYELVTGQSLFSGDDLVEVSTSITTASPAPPSTINKDACGLDAIILKCLAKKPEERYDSVRSLLDDLHAYLRQEMPPTHPLTESEAT